MKVLIILALLEYIVWLSPVAFGAIGTYKIAKNTGKTNGLSFILTSSVLVGVAVTVKEYLALNSIFTLKINFLIGNALILFAYLFFFIGVKQIEKEVNEWPRMPKRMVFYTIFVVLFCILPLFKKEYAVSLDLFIYVSIVIIVLSVVGKLYLLIEERKKEIVLFISLFMISLIFDFFMKGFSEILNLKALESLKLISFSFRAIASSLLFFVFGRADIKRVLRGNLSELYPITMRFVRNMIVTYTVITIIFSAVTYFAFLNLHNEIKGNLTHYAYVLSADAGKTGGAFAHRITEVRKALDILSEDKEVVNLSETGKKTMENFYVAHQDEILSVTRMDKNGIITFTYPDTKAIGSDISSQPTVKALLKTYKTVLSNPIKSVQGFTATVYHTPVFKNGQFDGSLAVLFNTNNIEKKLVGITYQGEKMIIADSYGTIIAAPDNNLLLKNIKDIIPIYTHSKDFVNSAFGRIFVESVQSRVFYNKAYTVVAFVPRYTILKNTINKNFNSLLLLIALVLSFGYLLERLKITYELQEEETRRIVSKKTKNVLILSEKFSQIVDFFSQADISEDIKRFSGRLLNCTLSLIDKGETGSVIVKEGDRFVFEAVKGFNKSLFQTAMNSEEIQAAKSEKPFIVKHIFENPNYSRATKELLSSVGTDKIKSTIEAPFIVNGKYFGGLFIDNFHSENAFTKSDLKIASALSKLGSIYIKNMLLLISERDAEEKLSFIVSEFSKLNILMNEEEFFNKVLQIGKNLVRNADAGSITLKHGNYFRYMAVFGYKKDVFMKLRLKVSDSYIIKEKKASVVKDIFSFNKHLDKEVINKFSEAGADRIKQTLVAPIIVNGEYFGGIFLDSFKNGEIFTDKDLQIVSTLSNLSSVFVSHRFSYYKLKKLSNFNYASVDLFHKVNLGGVKEEVIKVSYTILSGLYPAEIEEVGIGRTVGEFINMLKFNGKFIEKHVFEKNGIIEKAIGGRRSIFVEGFSEYDKSGKLEKEKKHRSEVLVFSGIENVSIFRIRFNKKKVFDIEEREFLERFGKEVIMIYQSIHSLRKTKELLISYVVSIANAVNARDPYTKGHSERVAALSVRIGEQMRLDKETRRKLLFAAVLHDVGKIGVPGSILAKPGRLSKEEYEIVKQHTVKGEEIVLPMDSEVAEIIRAHHEWFNGKGYPDHLAGEEIPLCARIITVADVFDALTTNRPYRRAFSINKAIKMIRERKGTQFDPSIVDVFLSIPMEEVKKILKNANMTVINQKYLN